MCAVRSCSHCSAVLHRSMCGGSFVGSSLVFDENFIPPKAEHYTREIQRTLYIKKHVRQPTGAAWRLAHSHAADGVSVFCGCEYTVRPSIFKLPTLQSHPQPEATESSRNNAFPPTFLLALVVRLVRPCSVKAHWWLRRVPMMCGCDVFVWWRGNSLVVVVLSVTDLQYHTHVRN